MRDRIPTDPGRVKMTRSDGTFEYVTLERADNPTQEGTPLSKALLDYAVAACGVTAGTATALTLDDAFGGFTLTDGAKVNFRLHVASGANPTLNVNGTGAKALVDANGAAIAPTPAGTWITATYSAESDCFGVSGGGGAKWCFHTENWSTNSVEISLPEGYDHFKLHVYAYAVERGGTSAMELLPDLNANVIFDDDYYYFAPRIVSSAIGYSSGRPYESKNLFPTAIYGRIFADITIHRGTNKTTVTGIEGPQPLCALYALSTSRINKLTLSASELKECYIILEGIA